jgi:hypothetical protein
MIESCDRDRLEFLRRDVFLLSKVLTSFASPHDVLCVFDRGRPIKPLSKSFTHESIWCCMVATSPRVYILQELYPVFRGYALLQDTAHAFMMDFIIPHNVGFGSLMYLIGLIPVNREDVVSQIVDEFLRPVWVRAYSLCDGEHARLEGRLSFNFPTC